MRKALVIGINKYRKFPLACCVNDARAIKELLRNHENYAENFDVELVEDNITRASLRTLVAKLFSGKHEIALLYFSGHGFYENNEGYLVTSDYRANDVGVSMDEILRYANNSESTNRVIILDCCHSGAMGSPASTGGKDTFIRKGMTILAASTETDAAVEINGHGLFTNLLLEALKGGAADLTGSVTPGSIYAYVDQALSAWKQRPIFKTNTEAFVSLRSTKRPIPLPVIKNLLKYFPSELEVHKLNPSYERTNTQEETPLLIEPYADPDNVTIFEDLQKMQRVGLIVPVDAPHMYFAAMRSKSCKLTPLGQHYWRLVRDNRIS